MQSAVTGGCDMKVNADKLVLDATCGSRMIWFNKENPIALFVDKRQMEHEAIWKSGDGKATRYCTIKPDVMASFTNLPFEDNTFWHVVFDPPHLIRLGDTSWLCAKYGKLPSDWEPVIREGVNECMRVLKPHGTLIFKWNEQNIPVTQILKVIDYQPLYGTRSGKQHKTIWMAFIKE